MKNQVESFVVVYQKGGKHFRINNETSVSVGLLEEHNAIKAELYTIEDGSKRLVDYVTK